MNEKIKIIQKAIVLCRGKFLLIQRSIEDTSGGLWDFPGGNLKFLESLEKGIKREIKEETGLSITNLKKISVHEFIRAKKKKHFILFLYVCNSNSLNVRLSKEHAAFVWIDKSNLKKYKITKLLSLTKNTWGKLIK